MVVQKLYPGRRDRLGSSATYLRDVISNANNTKALKARYNPWLYRARPIFMHRSLTALAASPVASTNTDR